MNNISIDKQIRNLMQERRRGFDRHTRKLIPNQENYMQGFDERYYLNEDSGNELPDIYSVSGKLNDNDLSNTFHNNIGEKRKTIKEKALELETLIVDSLVRESNTEAQKLFRTLSKMKMKYRDDNVKDIFLRVQSAMPKKKNNRKVNKYSANNNKNAFKEVLDSMSNDNVAPYNDNKCLSKLGEMWETCDTSICSQACKDRIMDAYNKSKESDCADLTTSLEDGSQVSMQDDIKNLIIQRLSYCKRLQDVETEGIETIDTHDITKLKQDLIKDIHKKVRLINLHYHSCQEKASKYIKEDKKLSAIVKMIAELDLRKLNLDKLQSLRKDITRLPSCDKIRYDNFEETRDEAVKNGLRVGKYVLPSDTEYYRQLKEEGKDNPIVYKDLASGKNYFYDAFSKTLTGIRYPETRPHVEEEVEVTAPVPSAPPVDSNLNDLNIEEMLGLDEVEKVEAEDLVPSPAPMMDTLIKLNNTNNEINNMLNTSEEVSNVTIEDDHDDEESILFGLNLNSLLGYILILLVVLMVLYVAVEMLK